MTQDTLTWAEIASLLTMLTGMSVIGGWVWRLQDRLQAIVKHSDDRDRIIELSVHNLQLSTTRDFVARADLAEMRREILDGIRRLEDRLDLVSTAKLKPSA